MFLVDKYVDPTNFLKGAWLINTSILQTFVKNVLDNKLSKADKNKRLNSFISDAYKKDTMLSSLVDQNGLQVAGHDLSASGVDAVAYLLTSAGLLQVWRCRKWSAVMLEQPL